MCCKLLAVIKLKTRGLEHLLITALLLPLGRIEPPRTAAVGIGVLWAEFPVQMFYRAVECFPLLPDFQQSEQLRGRHRIAMSIIDYFKSY